MIAAGYTALSRVYDRWQRSYGKDYSTLIFPLLQATFRRRGITPGTLLDVACGTGTLALKLAREGWLVSGVDASAGMLRAARASAAEAGLRAAFRRGDMRSFRIPARFSVITCMFDSLNHLGSAAELRSAFRRVAAHLEPGGWFIFDVNALRCFELLWTSTQTIEHRDFTLILKTSYDARRRTGTAFVTLFERDGKAFRKSTEVVRERWFSTAEVRQALVSAGLVVVEHRGFNFTPLRNAGKIKEWWVARRPA